MPPGAASSIFKAPQLEAALAPKRREQASDVGPIAPGPGEKAILSDS